MSPRGFHEQLLMESLREWDPRGLAFEDTPILLGIPLRCLRYPSSLHPSSLKDQKLRGL